MFRNLKAEMAREGLTGKDIANGIEISEKAFSQKINGTSEFTRIEMVRIRKKFFPNLSFEYLFDLTDEKKSA